MLVFRIDVSDESGQGFNFISPALWFVSERVMRGNVPTPLCVCCSESIVQSPRAPAPEFAQWRAHLESNKIELPQCLHCLPFRPKAWDADAGKAGSKLTELVGEAPPSTAPELDVGPGSDRGAPSTALETTEAETQPDVDLGAGRGAPSTVLEAAEAPRVDPEADRGARDPAQGPDAVPTGTAPQETPEPVSVKAGGAAKQSEASKAEHAEVKKRNSKQTKKEQQEDKEEEDEGEDGEEEEEEEDGDECEDEAEADTRLPDFEKAMRNKKGKAGKSKGKAKSKGGIKFDFFTIDFMYGGRVMRGRRRAP